MSEEAKTQEIEEKVMDILSNDPSDPVKLDNYDVYVVFQRPTFKDKYKGRAWGAKKLREFGYGDAILEDPELVYFFRMWGNVNTAVKKLYYQDDNGERAIEGKAYSEYSYNPEKDLDYGSVFEKYAIEEVFNKTGDEDMFVASGIIAFTAWSDKFSVSGDDIKNS